MATPGYVKKEMKTEVITDDLGRKITLRKPSMLTQYRIIDMLSTDSQMYASMCMPLAYITCIEDHNGIDESIGFASKREMEALIQRLEEEGVQAVMKAVGELFPSVPPDQAKDDLKKSLPTP